LVMSVPGDVHLSHVSSSGFQLTDES